MTKRRLGGDRGSVVAEFAVAFPAIALVVLFGVGALAAGAKYVRLQDAASDAARIVARGEPQAAASPIMSVAHPATMPTASVVPGIRVPQPARTNVLTV